MPIQVLMPALSPTMEKGNLAKWLKKEGDTVKSGDVIAEIETDKATMEMEAVDEGKLGKILVPEGTEKVAVNQPIAVLLQEGESAKDIQAKASAPKPEAKPAPAEAPKPQAPAPAPGAFKTVPHSSIRKTIARRLVEAKSTIPHFYLTIDTVIDDLLKLRKDINEKGGYKISVNDFVIKACAIALRKMPQVYASW